MSEAAERTTVMAARAPFASPAPVRRVRRCPCGCGHAGICDEHRARLAAIREELVAMGTRRSMFHQRSDQRYGRGDGIGRGSTCCNPHCWQARLPTERYCEDCQREGWSENDIE